MKDFDVLNRRQRALSALGTFYDKERDPTMDGTDPTTNPQADRRAAVAANAGLSSIHGGPTQDRLTYTVECPVEQGLVLTVERTWTKENGDPPQDMFIVCPVCGEEHTLVQRS